MSNKNLKVYRIQFMTEIGEMKFKVKFPCKLKVVWKRSNSSAETTIVPVEDGVARFNQTIKLNINMYFDTNNNNFVEKKCLYSFLIITDKGEKSAGSVTCDLAQLFNKRLYELKNQFPLQKCPLEGTTVAMRIFYEESTQQGYDSMSQISTNNLDTSAASVDLSELGISANEQKIQQKDSDSTSKQQVSSQNILSESNYDLLNESDLGKKQDQTNQISGVKMSANIQALNALTGKIDQFVSKCSGNIKNQLQNLRIQNSSLNQNLNEEKIQRKKLQDQKELLNKKLSQTEISNKNFVVELQGKIQQYSQTVKELQQKLEQSNKRCQQLENNMEKTGQSQNTYISDLKISYENNEKKLKQKISELNNQIIQEKKQKNEETQNKKKLNERIESLKEKYDQSQERYKQLARRQQLRESQLSQIRSKFQLVYERMVRELGEAFK